MEEQGSKALTENKPEETWGDVFRFAIVVLAIVIPFRIFIAQPYVVEGSSMDPTFKNGDYLIVDQISYRFHEPKRGDVIIMKYPLDTSKDFIKRIIGFPGEKVSIRNGEVFITPKGADKEIKIDSSFVKYTKVDNSETTLGEDQYFVLGDNRAGSSDSRYWGTLPKEDIIGRPLIRLFPFNEISVFPGIKNL